MAVVEKVFADKDGMVRQVMIRSNGGKFNSLPIVRSLKVTMFTELTKAPNLAQL
jgi:hypothetical protein